MSNSFVSVIIPTRNRQVYAEKTVDQIIGLNKDIEVIVHDNSDDDRLYSALKKQINANNVIYEYEKEVLPFSENYNRAAELATGKYLCAIGDDDGILPNITECARWMDNNEIDAVKPAKDQVYFYPGNANKRKNACLGFGYYTGKYYYSNPEVSVINLLNEGGCNYLEMDLIGSYHGLVSMESMNRVKDITGRYYSGLTPDMYSVICLSLLPNIKFAIIDYPITLPGICPSSGSAASDSGKHVGKLEEAPHLRALPNYEWSEYVPRYYSVETIWAETMIYAIKKMGREDLIERYFNNKRLASYLYFNNKEKRNEILQTLTNDEKSYVIDSLRDEDANSSARFSTILNNAAIKISGKRKVFRNINDINIASNKLFNELSKSNIITPWQSIR